MQCSVEAGKKRVIQDVMCKRKIMKNTLIILPALILLVSCSSTGVIPMGQNMYYIGKKDGSPGVGVSLSNKADVYREANVFCSKKSLEVKKLHETISPSAPGQLGYFELQFSCVQPGGIAQPLVKEPDTVIQVR